MLFMAAVLLKFSREKVPKKSLGYCSDLDYNVETYGDAFMLMTLCLYCAAYRNAHHFHSAYFDGDSGGKYVAWHWMMGSTIL